MALAVKATYLVGDHGNYGGYGLANSGYLSPVVNHVPYDTNSHVYPAYGAYAAYGDYDNTHDHHDSYVSQLVFRLFFKALSKIYC